MRACSCNSRLRQTKGWVRWRSPNQYCASALKPPAKLVSAGMDAAVPGTTRLSSVPFIVIVNGPSVAVRSLVDSVAVPFRLALRNSA